MRDNIGAVRSDLGARITEGNRATEELRERMDRNERTFADRVAAVIAKLPASGIDPHGGLAFGDSSKSSNDGTSRASYASCFSSDGRPRTSLGGSSSGRPSGHLPGPTREENYWLCRRSLRIWPVPGPDHRRSLGEFMKDRLRLSSATLFSMGEVSVKRAFLNPKSKTKD